MDMKAKKTKTKEIHAIKGEMQTFFDTEGVLRPVTLIHGKKSNLNELYKEGDLLILSGVSKGKGFAGVVKRHGFAGGPRTHGQSDRERAPGSIGSTTTPGRVMKGKRMAGRMGGERVTVKNLRILKIDPEGNILYVHGAVPGVKGSRLLLRVNEHD